MKSITYRNLRTKLNDGRLELRSDIFGTTTKFAEVRIAKTNKTETLEVVGNPKHFQNK